MLAWAIGEANLFDMVQKHECLPSPPGNPLSPGGPGSPVSPFLEIIAISPSSPGRPLSPSDINYARAKQTSTTHVRPPLSLHVQFANPHLIY